MQVCYALGLAHSTGRVCLIYLAFRLCPCSDPNHPMLCKFINSLGTAFCQFAAYSLSKLDLQYVYDRQTNILGIVCLILLTCNFESAHY